MAGPRGFETSDVLDAAVDSFWSAGFDAVSVRDLETATGLKAAGLYNAFGDKRGLFLAALTAYVNTRVRERIARRGRDPAADRVRGFVEEIIGISVADSRRRGCLMINSAVEVAPREPEVRRLVRSAPNEIETFFRVAAAEAGVGIDPDLPDPAALARNACALVIGLRVMARAGLPEETLRDAARPTLSIFDAATARVRERLSSDGRTRPADEEKRP